MAVGRCGSGRQLVLATLIMGVPEYPPAKYPRRISPNALADAAGSLDTMPQPHAV